MSTIERLHDAVDRLTGAGETTSLSQTDIHEVLSNPRRHEAVAYLAGEFEAQSRDPSVDWDALVEYLVVDECGKDYTGAERKRVYVSAYQTHLPKLEREGVVETDERSDVIRPGPEFDAVASVLEASERAVATGGSA